MDKILEYILTILITAFIIIFFIFIVTFPIWNKRRKENAKKDKELRKKYLQGKDANLISVFKNTIQITNARNITIRFFWLYPIILLVIFYPIYSSSIKEIFKIILLLIISVLIMTIIYLLLYQSSKKYLLSAKKYCKTEIWSNKLVVKNMWKNKRVNVIPLGNIKEIEKISKPLLKELFWIGPIRGIYIHLGTMFLFNPGSKSNSRVLLKFNDRLHMKGIWPALPVGPYSHYSGQVNLYTKRVILDIEDFDKFKNTLKKTEWNGKIIEN